MVNDVWQKKASGTKVMLPSGNKVMLPSGNKVMLSSDHALGGLLPMRAGGGDKVVVS
jgi:hypothetical protein